MSINTLVRRKIEEHFVTYLKAVLDDQKLDGRIYPTKGSDQLVMPFIVFACQSKQQMVPGARDNNDASHFDATAKLVLVTDSDDEALGPVSQWHDEMMRQIDFALGDYMQMCPVKDPVNLIDICGFYLDGDESAMEGGRYGDVITLQIFGRG